MLALTSHREKVKIIARPLPMSATAPAAAPLLSFLPKAARSNPMTALTVTMISGMIKPKAKSGIVTTMMTYPLILCRQPALAEHHPRKHRWKFWPACNSDSPPPRRLSF